MVTRKVTQRLTGATAGGWDTYLMDPTGKRFRSKQEIRRHFERIGEVFLRWEDFDFNPFGSKGQVKENIQKPRSSRSSQVIEEDQNIPFWEEPGDLDPSQLLDDDKFHCPQVRSQEILKSSNLFDRLAVSPFQVERSA